MTRSRPGGAVRVLGACARCNTPIANGLGSRIAVWLPTEGRAVRHDLVACRDCDAYHADAPTVMEAEALARNALEPIEVMEFAQRFGCDLGRVQRTARYFLGDARTHALAAELRETYLARRAQHDAAMERYRAHQVGRELAPAVDDDEDDFPF